MLPLLGFFNHINGYEIFVIGGVLLLFFGNRLPTVMRSLGKSVTEFKKGVAGIEEEIDASAAKTEVKQAAKTTD